MFLMLSVYCRTIVCKTEFLTSNAFVVKADKRVTVLSLAVDSCTNFSIVILSDVLGWQLLVYLAYQNKMILCRRRIFYFVSARFNL